jgi:hypothetical protein
MDKQKSRWQCKEVGTIQLELLGGRFEIARASTRIPEITKRR